MFNKNSGDRSQNEKIKIKIIRGIFHFGFFRGILMIPSELLQKAENSGLIKPLKDSLSGFYIYSHTLSALPSGYSM